MLAPGVLLGVLLHNHHLGWAPLLEIQCTSIKISIRKLNLAILKIVLLDNALLQGVCPIKA